MRKIKIQKKNKINKINKNKQNKREWEMQCIEMQLYIYIPYIA